MTYDLPCSECGFLSSQHVVSVTAGPICPVDETEARANAGADGGGDPDPEAGEPEPFCRTFMAVPSQLTRANRNAGVDLAAVDAERILAHVLKGNCVTGTVHFTLRGDVLVLSLDEYTVFA